MILFKIGDKCGTETKECNELNLTLLLNIY